MARERSPLEPPLHMGQMMRCWPGVYDCRIMPFSQGRMGIAHYVRKRILNPRFLNSAASCDVASNICQANYQPRQHTHFEHSLRELNGIV